MTFTSPWWLALLVVPIAIAAAYVVIARRRSRTTVKFTDVDLLASVAPRRPGWQRHLGNAGLVAVLTVLIAAIAGPAMAQRVPLDRATVVLVLDTSASMKATDVAPTRLAAAQAQARDFVSDLPDGLEVGLVAFSTQAADVVDPTSDRARLEAAIDSLQVGAGTATAAGIEQAMAMIEAQPKTDDGTSTPAAIVVMSDGAPTIGTGDGSPTSSALGAAEQAKAAGVPVYTIAFGTADGEVTVQGQVVPVPSDPETMAAIAEAGGGQTFTAETADELRAVYDQIGRDVAYEEKMVDLTPAFVGGAFVLAVLACCAGLYWNQRVV